ncbi:beta-ketoacyl synthase N-terminal-like domain-containing protein [Thalassomonas sp. RHCl1]|uniref:beta-ketoacyl synthase N-terminal-like domain-containing protein n=1 Tax=Thalassomonas sp. RHCl1 TaxID=2995320 RepID=UPI00248B44B3|nr:beta-ketoacyl synthase N-terminal-like domain-containing protein [Thalassomonas sp. RHCl1]
MARQYSIIGCGMINPLGIGAPAVSAAVRAGICQYQETDILSKDYQPFKMALVPPECLAALTGSGNQGKSAYYRQLIQLACVAIFQVHSQLDCVRPLPLMLALPSEHNMAADLDGNALLLDIARECADIIDFGASRCFRLGRAGGIAAFQAGQAMIESGASDTVLIGGVDSYLDLMQLGLLDQQQRLLTASSMDGFVPGEGAAFFALSQVQNNKITLGPPGFADEPGHIYSEEVCLGDGLSSAIRTALAGIKQPVKTVFSSFNGEHANGKEWGIALSRNSPNIDENFTMIHPADSYGDLGAATVPTLMILAYLGLLRGHYDSPLMLWSASDFAERGAILMAIKDDPPGTGSNNSSNKTV